MERLGYTPPSMVTGIYPYADFLTGNAAPPWKEGRVFYDDENKTFAIYNNEPDVTLQLGQEIYIRVHNVRFLYDDPRYRDGDSRH
jgi:hypothetical protein